MSCWKAMPVRFGPSPCGVPRDYENWNQGSELAQNLSIIRDRLHDQLVATPPQVNLEDLNRFTQELAAALAELPTLEENSAPDQNTETYRAFHEFLMQRDETLAQGLFNNLRYLVRDLTQYQSTLPRQAEGSALGQADLDPTILRITQSMSRLQELRQEENLRDWRPSEDTMNQWHTTLNRMGTQLAELQPELDPDLFEEISGQYQRLQQDFRRLMQNQEGERQVRETHQRIFSELYPRYRAALSPIRGQTGRQRATQAAETLVQMREALENAPSIFRDRRARVLANLRIVMESFLTTPLQRPQRPWRRVRAEANQLIQWIQQREEI